jgi:hypothetical protein
MPPVTNVTVNPATVHTSLVPDVRVTGSPDDEVGATVSGPEAKPWLPGEANVIVCAALATVIQAEPVLERNELEAM